jgi:hypothetical protein
MPKRKLSNKSSKRILSTSKVLGSRVYCQWPKNGDFYWGVITNVINNVLDNNNHKPNLPQYTVSIANNYTKYTKLQNVICRNSFPYSFYWFHLIWFNLISFNFISPGGIWWWWYYERDRRSKERTKRVYRVRILGEYQDNATSCTVSYPPTNFCGSSMPHNRCHQLPCRVVSK